jgi:hypothetical protein
MNKIAQVGVLASSLLLLTGCSDSTAKACEEAVKTKIEYLDLSKELHLKYLKLSKSTYDNREYTLEEDDRVRSLYGEHIQAKQDSNTVIINNPTCFSPKQVVEAQKIYEEARIFLNNW